MTLIFKKHNEKIKEMITQLSPDQLFIQPFYFGFGKFIFLLPSLINHPKV